MPERKMPIEFCPFLTIVMGDKLGKESRLLREKDETLKPKIQPVFRSKMVIVAGKSGRVKEIGEKFPVEDKLLFLKKCLLL